MKAHFTARGMRNQASPVASCVHARGMAVAASALVAALVLGDASAAARKSRHPAPATTSRDVENETTATIPARKMPPVQANGPSAASQDDEPLPPPFRLPTASRKRMRDCGLKWQTMKMSGEAGDNIWRSFATQCLAAATGPFDKPAGR